MPSAKQSPAASAATPATVAPAGLIGKTDDVLQNVTGLQVPQNANGLSPRGDNWRQALQARQLRTDELAPVNRPALYLAGYFEVALTASRSP